MAKQEIKRRETQMRNAVGQQGNQVEHTLTIDDSCLPSSVELKAYNEINPELITFLLETSKKEQNHRHLLDQQKIKSISYDSKSIHRINFWGMFFAFLIVIGGISLSAFLIYRDKEVVGTIFGGIILISAASLFINKGSKPK